MRALTLTKVHKAILAIACAQLMAHASQFNAWSEVFAFKSTLEILSIVASSGLALWSGSVMDASRSLPSILAERYRHK